MAWGKVITQVRWSLRQFYPLLRKPYFVSGEARVPEISIIDAGYRKPWAHVAYFLSYLVQEILVTSMADYFDNK